MSNYANNTTIKLRFLKGVQPRKIDAAMAVPKSFMNVVVHLYEYRNNSLTEWCLNDFMEALEINANVIVPTGTQRGRKDNRAGR